MPNLTKRKNLLEAEPDSLYMHASPYSEISLFSPRAKTGDQSLQSMKMNAIHENLNTSFVDLDALVRYLRSMQFIGRVHVELCAYEAEIIFTPQNTLQALEHDLETGVVSKGRKAFERIILRSRTSNGRIGVYRSPEMSNSRNGNDTYVEDKILADAVRMARLTAGRPAFHLLDPKDADRQEIEDLLSEILTTIDSSLSRANLNFKAAFHKACAHLSDEYPSLSARNGAVRFLNGRIEVKAIGDSDEFAEGVCFAIQKVMERLAERPSFRKVFSYTKHRILYLLNTRKVPYERHGLLDHLKRSIRIAF